MPCSFLSSIEVFFDFETKFSFFTIHGLSISTIHKSASLPIERFPLSILSIFAGLEETPGEVVLRDGRSYKSYRGMGSDAAMKEGSHDR